MQDCEKYIALNGISPLILAARAFLQAYYSSKMDVKCEYMVHPKSIRIHKNFCTSDNQFLIKFWLPPFSTEDSKSESWHSAKKIREVFMDHKSPLPPLFCNEKL